MTAEEAMAILDPETRRKTLRKIPVMDRIEADQEACRIAVAALRNLLQTNDPLTLEELREMDGEPVWLVGVSSINNFRGHWDICNLGGDSPAFPYCGENPDINLYGIMWKAYRRRPEEGTREN